MLVRLDGRIWRSDDLNAFVPVPVPRYDHGVRRLVERVVRRVQSELRLPYAALFESLRFAEACVQELQGFDLLYERFGWMGWGAGLAARRLGIPLVLEDNGDHLLDRGQGHDFAGRQRHCAGAARRAVWRAAHAGPGPAGAAVHQAVGHSGRPDRPSRTARR